VSCQGWLTVRSFVPWDYKGLAMFAHVMLIDFSCTEYFDKRDAACTYV
jgi:hypothetical protein